MIKEEDNELTTKININSIYSYGSNEKIILKQNEYLNQLIKFYKKQIEINKEKLVYYFKQDKDKIKEIFINDLKEINKKVKEINNKCKKEIEKLNIKNKYLNQNLLSNIKKLKKENEKLKEDNFLLLNQNNFKDSIIKLLNLEKGKLMELGFFQEFERTNLDYNINSNISLMEKELKNKQENLIKKEKKYNNTSIKVDSLKKEKVDLIKKIKNIINNEKLL